MFNIGIVKINTKKPGFLTQRSYSLKEEIVLAFIYSFKKHSRNISGAVLSAIYIQSMHLKPSEFKKNIIK